MQKCYYKIKLIQTHSFLILNKSFLFYSRHAFKYSNAILRKIFKLLYVTPTKFLFLLRILYYSLTILFLLGFTYYDAHNGNGRTVVINADRSKPFSLLYTGSTDFWRNTAFTVDFALTEIK